ncbi:HK97 gp10 family phage protein [Leucobacter tenebrionis]|uniref:HK97 gp10 family phage protein n=1 Tax=Leucobacter tenebrionis TaxID=2873270 RepID=UPI001CA709F1|nr:HK97 gp10 family phage protein [Leucobacter tenebrionis]QZY52920.1 HK97 gp10 family phage protein [Leucobacter tenebrionis]
MARDFVPDQAWFDQALRMPGVEALVDEVADEALAAAKASAPVDSADYKKSIRKRYRQARYRRVALVEATDPKSLLIEAKTGNLARSLKSAGRR